MLQHGRTRQLRSLNLPPIVWLRVCVCVCVFVCVRMCVRRPTSTCDSWAMANAANTAAQTKLGATAFATFTHFHLVMAVPSACSWAGLATLGGGVGGGGQVWLNTNTWTQTFGTFQVRRATACSIVKSSGNLRCSLQQANRRSHARPVPMPYHISSRSAQDR